ncbi:putative cytochrome P450 9f2 [Melipona quadrifasciata]|uniref:Putative cytochrome P450 9f2 n=1 Tax=Melipona quadrifasciata TaxID=166423 RepID=A0A0N0BE98_9HYME|nr:putative cytochrome P450 9f2 [Melipona quadrifasciata]
MGNNMFPYNRRSARTSDVLLLGSTECLLAEMFGDNGPRDLQYCAGREIRWTVQQNDARLDDLTSTGDQIPYAKPMPFVGNMWEAFFQRSFAEIVEKIYNSNPDSKYVGFFEFDTPVLLIRDLDLIKSITVKNFHHFPNHRLGSDPDLDPLFSKNVFSLRDERWKEVRNILTVAFTPSKMKSMFVLMCDCGKDYGDYFASLPADQSKEIELKDFRIKVLLLGSTECLLAEMFGDNGPRDLQYCAGREIRWTVQQNDARLDDLTSKGDQRGDFKVVFAGFESTSTLMCFAAYEIGINDKVQKRLQDEIDQVLEDCNGEVTYEAINGMKYLEAVIFESLQNETVCIPIYGIHHDPRYYPEPKIFNPDRFYDDPKQLCNSLSFGLGPRMCIGYRFALLETKVLLFHIFAKCDLAPCSKSSIPLKLNRKGFSMTLENGFWLKVQPRTAKSAGSEKIAIPGTTMLIETIPDKHPDD